MKKLSRLLMLLIEKLSGSWVRTQIPKTSQIMGFTVIDRDSEIGHYTYISRFCEITKSTIGNYCSIGSGVRIGSGEHDVSMMSTSAFITEHSASDFTNSECIIGHDVWIGTQSFIKRGVKVGNGAVIGANSVVTKNVPAYSIVAGNPAKILRFRFSESIYTKLEMTEWWNNSPSQVQKVRAKFESYEAS